MHQILTLLLIRLLESRVRAVDPGSAIPPTTRPLHRNEATDCARIHHRAHTTQHSLACPYGRRRRNARVQYARMSLATKVRAICVVSGKPLRSDGAPCLSIHDHHTDQCLLSIPFWCHQGAEIVQVVLDHGKLRPPDIISRVSRYDPKSAFSLSLSLVPRLDVDALMRLQ